MQRWTRIQIFFPLSFCFPVPYVHIFPSPCHLFEKKKQCFDVKVSIKCNLFPHLPPAFSVKTFIRHSSCPADPITSSFFHTITDDPLPFFPSAVMSRHTSQPFNNFRLHTTASWVNPAKNAADKSQASLIILDLFVIFED